MRRITKCLSSVTVTRETRLNLWFLAIFLVISLPGAVILFIKKLDPNASRMDEPDAVLTRRPFMAPVPAPPETRWMVPPKTYRWLTELTQQKTGRPMASAVPPGPEWEPVISTDHRIQLMSVASGGTTHLDLADWQISPAEHANRFKLMARVDDHDLPVNLINAESIEIPEPVRHELVNLGFAHPPARIGWINCDIEGAIDPGTHVTLTVREGAGHPGQSSVEWTIR